jgi:hypothetical protein
VADDPAGDRAQRRREAEHLREAERWFRSHGLAYFVPAERRAAQAALSLRRTVPVMVAVGLLAAAAGAGLARLTGQISSAPAVLVSLGLIAGTTYALIALRVRPIVAWGLKRTFGGLRTLLPMMSRALPLLLIFVTFLFINAEVWEMAAELQPGALWLVVLLFGAMAVGFLLVRLPEEVDLVDDAVDAAFLRRACAGSPLAAECARLERDPAARPEEMATVTGFERWNLILVLLIVQGVQVLLLAVTVFVFFLAFGAIAIGPDVQENWTGSTGELLALPGLTTISVPLVKVSLFLASFSALYLTVATITDETYRTQFFTAITTELERAVGMRAVYRWLSTHSP